MAQSLENSFNRQKSGRIEGEEIAIFKSYLDAQAAIDFLSDEGFAVENTAIIGRDLEMVERITGRLTWGKAAMNGIMSGAWMGMFAGLFYTLLVPADNQTMVFVIAVAVGVVVGVVFGLARYALSQGKRDFTSQSQVVASKYVIIASKGATQARDMLVDRQGNLLKPPAPVIASSDPGAPTHFGSRLDEEPRFGVRLPRKSEKDDSSATETPKSQDTRPPEH